MAAPINLSCLTHAQKDALIEKLFEQVTVLQQQVKDLQARLNMNSRDSSKPPSSDGYDKPDPKSRRGKRSGGQPGHDGKTLERRADPDHVIEHPPEHCDGCGSDLSDAPALGFDARQVFDLPPMQIKVSEHRALLKRCPCCQARCKGHFPDGVERAVQYGPGVHALATYFSQYQLLPYARLCEVFSDLFGLSLSQGTLDNILSRGGEHLQGFEQSVLAELVRSELVHFDESGLRVKTKLHWLHVASTALLTCYLIHPKRGVEAMDTMGILGSEFSGYAVHDHWGSYFAYERQLHVLCNAHPLRELTHTAEQHAQTRAAKLIDCLIDARHEVDAARATGARRLSQERLDYYDRRYDRILRKGRGELPILDPPPTAKRGRRKQHKVKNLHDRLCEHKPEVFAFLYQFDLPFDNNLAERDVRMVKVNQKVSGCFRSERGAAAFARIRGFISTAKKQRRNVFASLVDALNGKAFDPVVAISA